MRTIYSERHALHDSRSELFGGELVPPFECPRRAEIIKARIEEVGLGPIEAPVEHGLEPLLAVHDDAYLRFLETAFARWQAAGAVEEVGINMVNVFTGFEGGG